MKYIVKLDYASFGFTPAACMSVDKVAEIIAGGAELGFRQIGESQYSPYHSSACGLFYKPNTGSIQIPQVLQVSGSGCELFRQTLPALGKTMFDFNGHFTRLDFCYDVVMTKSEWRDFYFTCMQRSVEDSDVAGKRMKRMYQGFGDETTLYIGARKGSRYCRIYNKTLESKGYYVPIGEDGLPIVLNDGDMVIRFELECKYTCSVAKNKKTRIFDPTSLFFAYYHKDHSRLFDFLRDTWRKYGREDLCLFFEEEPEFMTDIDARKLPIVSDDIVSPYSRELRSSVGRSAEMAFASEERKTLWAMDIYGWRFIEALINHPESLYKAVLDWSWKRQVSCPLDAEQLIYAVDELVTAERMCRFDFDDCPEDYSPYQCEQFEEIDILKERRNDDDL